MNWLLWIKLRCLKETEICSLFYLPRFHNEFMKQWITLVCIINKKKRAVVRSSVETKLISGRGVWKVETSKNQQKKKTRKQNGLFKNFLSRKSIYNLRQSIWNKVKKTKLNRIRKLWYLFLRNFRQLLSYIHFLKGAGH